jgi:cytoskeletal protein CcmA (bactofilin family)
MVFGKKKPESAFTVTSTTERVTSVLGPGINWKGDLRGKGGVRIEGTMEGEIAVRGMIIIGETGRVTCPKFEADTVIVAGVVNAEIIAKKLEIRTTGRVYGDVTVQSFSTEEGAFLRGKVTMEDTVKLTDLPEDTGESEPATKTKPRPLSSEE